MSVNSRKNGQQNNSLSFVDSANRVELSEVASNERKAVRPRLSIPREVTAVAFFILSTAGFLAMRHIEHGDYISALSVAAIASTVTIIIIATGCFAAWLVAIVQGSRR